MATLPESSPLYVSQITIEESMMGREKVGLLAAEAAGLRARIIVESSWPHLEVLLFL